MRIAVFGATGDQGAAQIRRLAAAGHAPIAITRHPQNYPGAARFADFADHASLAAAITGCDGVFLNLPSTSFNAAEPLIAAAEVIARAAAAAPGMRMLVFNTSLPVSKEKMGYMAQDARVEMRARIFASKVPCVVFQPVVFLDNLLKAWAWPSIAERHVVRYPHAETLDVSWICHDDLADLMIAALARPHLAGRIFVVGGGETVRGPELARRLSRAWGCQLSFETETVEAYAARMYAVFRRTTDLDRQTLVDELVRNYTRYNTSPERPFLVDMAPVLRELPVPMSSIEAWARRQQLPTELRA